MLFTLFTTTLYAWSFGPPAYKTGAPGDKGTCNATDCHNTFPLNSGSAQFTITGKKVYTPGKPIVLTIAFANSVGKYHGFEITAVDANGNRAGTFKKTSKKDSMTQVIPPNTTDPFKRGLDKADMKKYMEQTFKGKKKISWRAKWTAPSGATDPITFYAAGVEADGDLNSTNDYVYTVTKAVHIK